MGLSMLSALPNALLKTLGLPEIKVGPKFDEHAYHDSLVKYAQSRSLNPETFSLLDNMSFQHYLDKRAANATQLTSLEERLKKSSSAEQTTAVRDQINTTLQLSSETSSAGNDFDERLDFIRTQALNGNTPATPEDLIAFIKQGKDTALQAIHQQYANEKEKIDALFKDTSFIAQLKKSTGLTTASQIGNIKRDLLNDHQRLHQEGLKAFNDKVNTYIPRIEHAAKAERERVFALRALEKSSSDVKKEIDELAATNRKRIGEYIGFSQTEEEIKIAGSRYKGIALSRLKHLKTETGLNISVRQVNKKIKENGKEKDASCIEFHVSFPSHLNFFYHLDATMKMKRDIASIVKSVTAAGCKSIYFEISNDNEDRAMEAARLAYEACLEAGFDDSNIKVTVSFNSEREGPKTKTMSAQEIFGQCPSRLTSAEIKAEAVRKARTEVDTQLSNRQTQSKLIEDYKLFKQSKQEPTPPPPELRTK